MNKKLFFAGFALLAAVSFTSCNSDNPIDVTDPNGVRPATSTHYVGGSYDWTATPKNYAELQDFWAKDGKDVADLLKNNKDNVADILIDVTGYELAGETIFLPDFFAANGGTSTAKGKKVNITFTGNFKKADFERAHVIAGDGKAFPVIINTNNLAGAEVNFTFNVEKFDLELYSTLTRSTFSGAYTIGYMFAQTATKQSALEVKEGTVEGLDVESTGDYKGDIDGVWTKTADNQVYSDGKGLYANFYDATLDIWKVGITINGAKDIFVEKDARILPQYQDWSGAGVDYALGTVKFVQKDKTKATVSMIGYIGNNNNEDYTIESIVGKGASICTLRVGTHTLDGVEAVSKVTIPTSVELKRDVFTDVTFSGIATFNTNDVAAFDDVTFDYPRILVGSDNAALSFANVTFNRYSNGSNYKAYILSGINVTNVADYYTYNYYQWVISDQAAHLGKWMCYKSDLGNEPVTAKDLMEYNKGFDPVEFDADYVSVDANGDLQAPTWYDTSAATNLIKLAKFHPENVAQVIPEGTTITFDSKCKFWNSKKTVNDGSDYGLNMKFGHKVDSKETWYDVIYDGKAYSWRRVNYGNTEIYWDLVPPTTPAAE